jgi:hypothetical protein
MTAQAANGPFTELNVRSRCKENGKQEFRSDAARLNIKRKSGGRSRRISSIGGEYETRLRGVYVRSSEGVERSGRKRTWSGGCARTNSRTGGEKKKESRRGSVKDNRAIC